MLDNTNRLAAILLDGLNDNIDYGYVFEDFTVYDEYPVDGSLHFPCLIVLREPAGITTRLFGNQKVRALNLLVEVAFKEKSGFVAREHDYLSTEKLVMWYEERMDELVDALNWDRDIYVDSVYVSSERHFPEEKNQELYGLTYRITINYVE
jgi:hypothetical protein